MRKILIIILLLSLAMLSGCSELLNTAGDINNIKIDYERTENMNLEEYLYDRVLPVINSWQADGMYVISFFVNSNEVNRYNGIGNFPEFSIGYNTEKGCRNASQLSEERWNIAFWRGSMTEIISAHRKDEGAAVLYDWYMDNGIDNIGCEDEDSRYKSAGDYIGKGPNGFYELLCAVSNVARRLQTEGVIKDKFGAIPIIVHDYEYPWYVEEATSNANPNGEANVFLQALREDFPD